MRTAIVLLGALLASAPPALAAPPDAVIPATTTVDAAVLDAAPEPEYRAGVDNPEIPCRLAVVPVRHNDDVDGEAVAVMIAALATAIEAQTGCEVAFADHCTEDACIADVGARLGVAGVVVTFVDVVDGVGVVVAAELRNAVTGVVVARDDQPFLSNTPTSAVEPIASALQTGLKRPPPSEATPAPAADSVGDIDTPTSPATPATSATTAMADDPAEAVSATPTVSANHLPVLYGGIGVGTSGLLVLAAGGFVLGNALIALDDPDTLNPASAQEEVAVGSVVAVAGAAVAIAGAVMVGVVLLDDHDDNNDSLTSDGAP